MRVVLSIFFFFLAILVVPAQTDNSLSGKSLGTLKQLHQQGNKAKLFYAPFLHFSSPDNAPSPSKYLVNTNSIPLAYAYKDLAIFCKLEVKMEKVVKMPVKFRLGSVDYVDWLEGKRDRY